MLLVLESPRILIRGRTYCSKLTRSARLHRVKCPVYFPPSLLFSVVRYSSTELCQSRIYFVWLFFRIVSWMHYITDRARAQRYIGLRRKRGSDVAICGRAAFNDFLISRAILVQISSFKYERRNRDSAIN